MKSKAILQKNLKILAETGTFKEVMCSTENEADIVLTKGKLVKIEENIIIQDEQGNRIEIPKDGMKEIIVEEGKGHVYLRGIKGDSKISTLFCFTEGDFDAYLERLREAKVIEKKIDY